MANALTAIRLLLAAPFAALMAAPDPRYAIGAALILTAAIASDILDGIVARRHGTASAEGQLFDHATDAVFASSGLAGAALRGVVPWVLPVVVAAAFAQYVIDSRWIHRAAGLRGSRLGRYNGILYFAPLVADILVRVGFRPLQPLVVALAWILVASTAVSMTLRALAALRARGHRAPASPGAGRRDR
jgi:CDP-diacylglycerol--glycerol-3-phosphate 3-phosphatidyltransferase